jgi:hypothetical protein
LIDPTEEDIGRAVKYTAPHGAQEYGRITSYNDSFVFVRYGAGDTSAATKREQLEWN